MVDNILTILIALAKAYILIGVTITVIGYIAIFIKNGEEKERVIKAGLINIPAFIMAIAMWPSILDDFYTRYRLRRLWRKIEKEIENNNDSRDQ